MPARLVQEAAVRHDQSVKVACAASLGFYDVTGDDAPEFLHGVSDAALPPDFVRAYSQIRLDAKFGGHGLRAWSVHADAAFVGQWALTVQSAQVRGEDDGVLHYPVLAHVVEQASASLRGGGAVVGMPIVRDLAEAWERSAARTREAVRLSLPSPNPRVASLGGWLLDTEGDVGNIISMPEHAQRRLPWRDYCGA